MRVEGMHYMCQKPT